MVSYLDIGKEVHDTFLLPLFVIIPKNRLGKNSVCIRTKTMYISRVDYSNQVIVIPICKCTTWCFSSAININSKVVKLIKV